MSKVELLATAIDNGINLMSELPAAQMGVPALTSIRIRHILNNIGKLAEIHLECGVHKGGTYTATIANNSNIKTSCAIDSFASDFSGESAMVQFLDNRKKFESHTSTYKLFVNDTFKTELWTLPKCIDLYMYDGCHSYESQRKALTYFKDNLANEFIFICDDYDWEDVKNGTQDGIKDAEYIVLYEKVLVGNDHDNDGFWNGLYIALLKKTA